MSNSFHSLNKRILTIPRISRLQFDDEAFIRSSLPKDSIQYARSFLYLLRASHGNDGTLGYKYVSSDCVAIIGYRRNRIYITPVMDTTRGILLEQLCQKIFDATTCDILIKKFSIEYYTNMKKLQKNNVQEDILEDDTCPETMITLSKLYITPEGNINPKAEKFIRTVKRFEKYGIQFTYLDDITQVPLQKIVDFLSMNEEKRVSYLPIITYLYTHGKDTHYRIMIFKENNKVAGLYIVEAFSPTELGLYCAVTARNKKGITEWMDWYFFRKMYLLGIQAIYFGGAESWGVDYYIKKLLPNKPPYLVTTVRYIDIP